MKRLLLAGAAALTLSLGATSCAAVDPDAAVVDGTHTSVRDFEALLTDLRSVGAPGLESDGAAVPAAGARSVLGTVVLLSVIHGQYAARGLAVDAATAQEATTTAPDVARIDAAAFAKLPKATQDMLTQRTAEFLALRASLSGPAPSEEQIAAFYEQNKDQMNGASLDEMRARITSYLQGQPATDALQALFAAATVKLNPRYGAWDPAKGVVALATPLTAR
jgi:hypothetical protein